MTKDELFKLSGLVFVIDGLLSEMVNARTFGQWERLEICRQELLLAYTDLYTLCSVMVKGLCADDCTV